MKNFSEYKAYTPWRKMISRCRNKNDTNYKNYGARGICVTGQWLRFENFLRDMGECPDGLTLDRIDTYGNYEPGNCRWATRTQQAQNKRVNVNIKFKGKTLCAAEWSRITGINHQTIAKRFRSKWDVERIFADAPLSF